MGQDAFSTLSEVIRVVQRIAEICERALVGLYVIEQRLQDRSPPVQSPVHVVHPSAVQNFHLDLTSAGGPIALIDGKYVKLTPTLAAFITILASDEEHSTDEFVAFKSADLVAERLGRKLGRSFSRHNVSQLLYRLRKAVREPGLIERSPAKGLRLRLKRCSKGPVAE